MTWNTSVMIMMPDGMVPRMMHVQPSEGLTQFQEWAERSRHLSIDEKGGRVKYKISQNFFKVLELSCLNGS